MVLDELRKNGVSAKAVLGDTPSDERERAIAEFKSGELRAICGIGILTTGFDAPRCDSIVLLRPTMSPGLHAQMLGRGLRVHESKTDTLILDCAGNISRHGPIDKITGVDPKEKSETRACPKCAEIIPSTDKVCPACGYEFPAPSVSVRTVANHATTADNVSPISGDSEERIETFEVVDYDFMIWTKKGASPDAPKSLRVEYYWSITRSVSEWICFSHSGFARRKAEEWWKARHSSPIPATTQEAFDRLKELGDAFAWSKSVRVKLDGKWPELVEATVPHPCDTCLMWDRGFCHHFGEDVPLSHQLAGCANWKSVVENNASSLNTYGNQPNRDELPF